MNMRNLHLSDLAIPMLLNFQAHHSIFTSVDREWCTLWSHSPCNHAVYVLELPVRLYISLRLSDQGSIFFLFRHLPSSNMTSSNLTYYLSIQDEMALNYLPTPTFFYCQRRRASSSR